jgi:DNA-binding response OmpR family regulator
MLSRLLARASYEVLLAGNGRQALSVLEEHTVDLLITDIIMPEKEGIELITTVRVDQPKLPIIAISGGGQVDPDQYLELARMLGANRVLGKPFDIDELLEACRQLTSDS